MTTTATTSALWPEPAKAGAKRSILASDLVIDGDILSVGPVEVQGKITGQVKSPDVLIATTGQVDGSVVAGEIVVQGSIAGIINARKVSLSSTALVQADVTHEQIAMESGAQIDGRLKRAR